MAPELTDRPARPGMRGRKRRGQKDERSLRSRRRWRRRWYFLKYGTPTFIVLFVLLIFVFFFRHRMLITVGSGQVGVIYYRLFGGTSDTVKQEGLTIIAPWDRAYIYSIRTQTLIKPMTVLSNNGLEVHLDAQIRFHPVPETIPYLHRRLGPDYVITALLPPTHAGHTAQNRPVPAGRDLCFIVR